jgi:hypothetical protein
MTDRVTAKTLNSLVEFDCPFRVNHDGTLSHRLNIYAPEMIMGNEIEDEDRRKYLYPFPNHPQWELISGFSGQDHYAGPVMHNSEYLGGYMAEYVLNTPGVYVLTAVYWEEEGPEAEGWVLARLKEANDVGE